MSENPTNPAPTRVCIVTDFGDKLEVHSRHPSQDHAIDALKSMDHGEYTIVTLSKRMAVGEPKRAPRTVVRTVESFSGRKMTEEHKEKLRKSHTKSKKVK